MTPTRKGYEQGLGAGRTHRKKFRIEDQKREARPEIKDG
jgi:hypothetical protein